MKNKKVLILLLSIVILMSLTIFVLINIEKDVIKTDGITLEYKILNEDGWSKSYKNGQIAGKENKSIMAIQAKIKSEKYGHILYNICSSDNCFSLNDTYDGEVIGDKKNSIYGVKFYLTDDLFKNYEIYYRTHNKKDGWLEWTSRYNISGDNEVDIDQIQIKILKKGDKFKQDIEKASIGF